jgi:hypothetical protein
LRRRRLCWFSNLLRHFRRFRPGSRFHPRRLPRMGLMAWPEIFLDKRKPSRVTITTNVRCKYLAPSPLPAVGRKPGKSAIAAKSDKWNRGRSFLRAPSGKRGPGPGSENCRSGSESATRPITACFEPSEAVRLLAGPLEIRRPRNNRSLSPAVSERHPGKYFSFRCAPDPG